MPLLGLALRWARQPLLGLGSLLLALGRAGLVAKTSGGMEPEAGSSLCSPDLPG